MRFGLDSCKAIDPLSIDAERGKTSKWRVSKYIRKRMGIEAIPAAYINELGEVFIIDEGDIMAERKRPMWAIPAVNASTWSKLASKKVK